MLKVEVISTEMIKPSSSTPLHLRNFRQSLMDQLAPQIYIPLCLFYTTNNMSNHLIEIMSDKLKRSLSETLAALYPLAGRMKEDDTINCNDEGAEFSHAQVNGQLTEFLKKPHLEVLDQLLPCDYLSTRSGADVPLAIQFNAFECGGVAIGVRLSHKIADGATLGSFLTKWATIARGDMQSSMDDVTLVSDSLFPPRASVLSYHSLYAPKENVVTKRLVFDASAIAALKTRAADYHSHPTRVEVVSALIWHCSMKAQQKEKHAPVSVLTHAVNLRGRMVPPVPDSYFGNLSGIAITKGVMVIESCKDKILHKFLEKQVRDAVREIEANFVDELQGPDGALKAHQKMKKVTENYLESGFHICHFSSWCRFPFYDVDFGWGKPTWIGCCNVPAKNVTILLGMRGSDGIEAWVGMEVDEMAKFEQDQELLSFATIP